MSDQKLKLRFTVVSLIVAGLMLSRFLPFPPNFSPILAAAMFGGTYFFRKRQAFIIPIVVMAISDAIQYKMLGFEYPQMITLVVYATIALVVFLGTLMRNKTSVTSVIAGSLGSSVSFFMLTNFFVWLGGTMYSMTWDGLITCYVAALPYFHYTIISGLVFSCILYGGYALVSRRFEILSFPVKS